jgi:hypothetical protein
MTDLFATHATVLDSPAQDGFAIAPSDGNDLAMVTRAIFVGSGGALKVTMLAGSTLTLDPVPAGMLLPLRVRRVHATGTTATALVGLF